MEDTDLNHHHHRPEGQSAATNSSSSSLVVVNNDQFDSGAAFEDVNGVGADDYRHMASQLSDFGSDFKNQGRMLDIGGSRELWIPPGFKFAPSDEDLIMEYLMPKLWNKSLPCTIIKSVNIYDYDPIQLTERYKRHSTCSEWFFFTPREKKYPNGKRPNRAAGDGFWKATGADKGITARGRNVGCRKALVYYSGKPSQGIKTNWIMHEYRADNAPLLPRNTASTASTSAGTDMRLDQWVLCRIYQKIGRGSQETGGDPQMNGQDEDHQQQQQGDGGLGVNQDHEDQRAQDHAPMGQFDATHVGDVNQMAAYHMNMHDATNGNVNQMVADGMNMMNTNGGRGLGVGVYDNGLVHQRYSTYQQAPMMGSYDHVGNIHVNEDMLRMNRNVVYNNGVNRNYSHNQGEVVRPQEGFQYKMQQPVIPRIEHAIDHHQRIGSSYLPTNHHTSSSMYHDDGNNNVGGGDFLFTPDDDDDDFLRPEGLDPRYYDGHQDFGDCSFPDHVLTPPNGIGHNAPPLDSDDKNSGRHVSMPPNGIGHNAPPLDNDDKNMPPKDKKKKKKSQLS